MPFIAAGKFDDAHGHEAAIERALENDGSPDWKNKTVGFRSDGASIMVGNRGGVCCLFQPEIPQLIGMH